MDEKFESLIGGYFEDEILQFSAIISGEKIKYRGYVYCWFCPNELVFFNANLKHLFTLIKEEITGVVFYNTRPDIILLQTAVVRVKLRKQFF